MDPDVMFLQSSLSDEYLQALTLYKRHNRAFRVFELDDLKCKVPEKNSRRKFLFREMKERLNKALALCDRLIVTTEPLVDAMRAYIDDIRVIPNYLEGSRWSGLRSQRRQGRLPRVGWAGAQQHQGDLEFLVEVVKATAGDVEWVFFGMCLDELRPYVAEVHDFGDFESYPQKLASLNLDLAVAPLEYHPFNEAKSNLRLLEYGNMGWPVICTDIFPYQNAPVVRLANDARAWIEAIRERAHDLDTAAKEGDCLQQWVRSNWMLEDHLHDWLNALSPNQSDVKQRAAG
jgi:glycosyltransferase involved in cell wall biosynthesis